MKAPDINDLLTPEGVLIFPGPSAEGGPEKDEIIRALCEAVTRRWSAVTAEQAFKLVSSREASLPTRFGPLLAVPHAVIPGEDETRLAAAVVPGGVRWDSGEDNLVRLVMLFAGGAKDHLKVLSDLARRLSEDDLLHRLISSESPEEFFTVFTRAGTKTTEPRYHRGRDISALVFQEALQLRDSLPSARLVLHADALASGGRYIHDLAAGKDVIIVTTREGAFADNYPDTCIPVILPFKGARVPPDVRFSLLYLLGLGVIEQDDMVINAYGKPGSGFLDSIKLVQVCHELNVHAIGGGFGGFPEDVDLSVFNRVVYLAVELASEGREGKPVGTIFVVGCRQNLASHTTQMIANPFHGYAPGDRNVLDPGMEETIKEYAKIDGAFIISGDGTIESAGTFLSGRPAAEEMTSGLGARHAAAQGITAVCSALAVVISESTRKVTVFRSGKKIMEL